MSNMTVLKYLKIKTKNSKMIINHMELMLTVGNVKGDVSSEVHTGAFKINHEIRAFKLGGWRLRCLLCGSTYITNISLHSSVSI